MQPLLLNPPIKDYIWGGTKLREQFGKGSSLERLAESWELSCHKDGSSVIANGDYAGRELPEYLREHPEALGTSCGRFEFFPVLIKLIDARDNLSVQVHPDNEYARRVEGEYGKTEMWYIVDCDEGAELIYGFREKITREDFRRAIETNTLLDRVNRVPVKKGDVFFISAGTLHAIGKGILIAEIQQNSNTTYRVYDYGRLGTDGKPRELHIEKALDVTNLTPAEVQKAREPVMLRGESEGTTATILAGCEYFNVTKINMENTAYSAEADSSSFIHVLVVEGTGLLEAGGGKFSLKKGTSIFIPAGTGKIKASGNCSTICTDIGK